MKSRLQALANLLILSAPAHDRQQASSHSPLETRDEREAFLSKAMADLSHLSSQSRLVSDDRSGHHIHIEDPPAVIDAIRDVLRKARPQ